MKFLVAICLLVLGAGCTKSPGSITPIQQVGCDVETAIIGAASSAIAGAVNCSNTPQIQQDIQTALGNVNLCSAGLVPPPAGVAAMSAPKWSKIGDVSKKDIDAAKQSKEMKAEAIKPMGVVGNIACPIVVNTLLGFATNSIPASWGCSANTSASSLGQVIVSACEAAIPL